MITNVLLRLNYMCAIQSSLPEEAHVNIGTSTRVVRAPSCRTVMFAERESLKVRLSEDMRDGYTHTHLMSGTESGTCNELTGYHMTVFSGQRR